VSLLHDEQELMVDLRLLLIVLRLERLKTMLASLVRLQRRLVCSET